MSPLRLSVRNIPGNYDEKKLKALFVKAVKERATKENPVIKQVGFCNHAIMLLCRTL